MSDLPERIWFDGLHAWKYDPPNAIGYREFVRADLAPTVGFSVQQMREAMVQCVVSDDKIDEILEALTPAAQPRDPAVLVEALEYYAKQRRYGEDGGLAREALAEWNARQPEAKMLDLGGVPRYEAEVVRGMDGQEVSFYGQGNGGWAVLPDLPSREELVDMMHFLGESDDEGNGWAVWDRDFGKIADNILDRIKGAKHE